MSSTTHIFNFYFIYKYSQSFSKNNDFRKKLSIYSFKKKKIIMKKLLVKWFGAEWYCEWFHSVHSDKNDNTKWYCDECKFSRKKDNFFI